MLGVVVLDGREDGCDVKGSRYGEPNRGCEQERGPATSNVLQGVRRTFAWRHVSRAASAGRLSARPTTHGPIVTRMAHESGTYALPKIPLSLAVSNARTPRFCSSSAMKLSAAS